MHFDIIYTQSSTSDDHRQTGGATVGQENRDEKMAQFIPLQELWQNCPSLLCHGRPVRIAQNSSECSDSPPSYPDRCHCSDVVYRRRNRCAIQLAKQVQKRHMRNC